MHQVVTAVPMPEMDGIRLGARLRTDFPDTKNLFVKAFTEDATFVGKPVDRGHKFLQKPYTLPASPGRCGRSWTRRAEPSVPVRPRGPTRSRRTARTRRRRI